MIVQCDQCSTKFKLDDAKLTETGVKVRCSKCRHIFVVKKEVSQEEPDFDSMLVGLDGSASEAASSSRQDDSSSFDSAFETSFTSEEQPSAGPTLAVDDELLKAAEDSAVSFAEEPAAFEKEFDFGADLPAAAVPAEPSGEFDFSSFEMPPASESPGEYSPNAPQEFDFGEMPSEPVTQGDESREFSLEEQAIAPPSAIEEPFAGEFSFEETAPEPETASPEQAAGEFEFAFSEPSWEPPVEQPASDSSADLTTSGDEPLAEEPSSFSFTDEASMPTEAGVEESFSFEPAPLSEPSADEQSAAMVEKEEFSFESVPLAESRATAEQMAREVPPFAAADESLVVPAVADESLAEEELPPLTISSRKKEGGTSRLRTALLGVFLLVAVGAGVFSYLGGKAENDKGVPGGGVAVKGLPIEIVNVKAGYVINNEAGELFVVRGEAINRSKEARGSIQVKGTVFSKNGALLVAQNAYCGNPLSNEQLVGMSMAAIEKAMGNQFGDSLANMEVKPGKSIPFTIIFAKVPADAGEFGIEISGATLAKAK